MEWSLTCLPFRTINYVAGGLLLFRILFPIVIVCIVYEIHLLVSSKNNKLFYLITITLLCLGGEMIVLNQTYFWIVGFYTYIVPLPFILFCLIKIASNFTNIEIPKICDNKIALFIFSFVSCLFVEHYSLLMLGLSLANYFYKLIKTKSFKVDSSSLALLLGSFLGVVVVFGAPGIQKRVDTDDFKNLPIIEKLYFGYSRFIYTFFYLDKRIFLIISLVLVTYYFKNNHKLKHIMTLSLTPIIIFSIIFIFDIRIFKPMMIEALSGAWSYYSFELMSYLKYSLIPLYFIFVVLINIIYISYNEDNWLLFVLYGASVMCSLCFILTDKACERTQYISWFLIAIIIVYIISYIDFKNTRTLTSLLLIIFITLSFNLVINYSVEQDKYITNERRYLECKENNCNVVKIQEHNWKYVFKSELDFDNQDCWVLNNIRKYYDLNKKVKIIPE